MKINARQLGTQLSRRLAPIYLVCGDEPLLVAEAAAQVRAAARRQGFAERELFVAERGFKWAELEGGADNLSLFVARRLIELRLPSPRPGDAGSKVLQALASRDDPDRLVLVVTGKLDAAAARSSWVKAIDAQGVVAQVWPVERAQLPDWIRARAADLEVKLTQGAAELLADRVEGNLLAADQELNKLAILAAGTVVDEDGVLAAVANSARFDVFRLVDALLGGDARRSFGVLAGLRAEGAEPALVVWALSRELCLLARMAAAVGRGQQIGAALAEQGVWKRRQALIRRALGRYEAEELGTLLRRAAEVDRVVKGAVAGNAWHAITELLLLALDPRRSRSEVA